MIKIAPVKAKGRSVPFVLAADGWKRMLVSKSYSSSNIDWRTAFANDIKKIWADKLVLNKQKKTNISGSMSGM